MKVSILGTNGFLSTIYAQFCNQKKYELDMYGLNEPKDNSFSHFFKVNLATEDLDYISLKKSDIIVYAIGAGIQANLKESSALIYNLNVTVPMNICNKLRGIGYKGVFISFGSYFEMGNTLQNCPLTELDIENSTFEAPNDYAVSKRMLTRFASSFASEFTYWHFILPTIYGEKENPLRLIPYTINSIINNTPLSFTVGNQVRQYVYVNEVANVIDMAYKKHLPAGIYNIAGPEIFTVKDLVMMVGATMGKEVPPSCFGSVQRSDASKMKYLALNGDKLYKVLDYKYSVLIMDVIAKYEALYRTIKY
jgi:NAD dependent epimerase/dehydratase family.